MCQVPLPSRLARRRDVRHGIRNVVVHEYFRIESGVIRDVVDSEVAPLAVAIRHYLGEPTAPSGDTRG